MDNYSGYRMLSLNKLAQMSVTHTRTKLSTCTIASENLLKKIKCVEF